MDNDKSKSDDKKTDGKDGKQVATTRELAMISSIGIAIGVSTVLGYFFGRYLDGLFDTKPVLMIVFLLFGVAGGFWNAYQTIKKHMY